MTTARIQPNRHRFHALCPYFAMFPEAFAEHWIARLTRPGDVVIDPFCGRGTLPFQALLMNRGAVAADINPVAYCITRAKTCAPRRGSVLRRITQLEAMYRPRQYEHQRQQLPIFFKYAYAPETLRQLLFLRSELNFSASDTDCMLAALILGSLHGESERSSVYLSNQMPHTISTKPAYSVRFWQKHGFKAPKRNVFSLMKERLVYRYESPRPTGRATVLQLDMRELPRTSDSIPDNIRCSITSPPYFDVTSYEEDQWLRLWFLGGPPFPTSDRIGQDDRHNKLDDYWQLIGDMWRVLGLILAEKANVVVRLGAVHIKPEILVSSLEAMSSVSGRRVRLESSVLSSIERRQTDTFRPGSRGCKVEVDCHFVMR